MIDNSEQHTASQQVIIIFLHAQKSFNIMIFPSILAGFYRSIKSKKRFVGSSLGNYQITFTMFHVRDLFLIGQWTSLRHHRHLTISHITHLVSSPHFYLSLHWISLHPSFSLRSHWLQTSCQHQFTFLLVFSYFLRC